MCESMTELAPGCYIIIIHICLIADVICLTSIYMYNLYYYFQYRPYCLKIKESIIHKFIDVLVNIVQFIYLCYNKTITSKLN